MSLSYFRRVSASTDAYWDTAAKVTHHAFETVWGLNVPGSKRAALFNNLANLMEKHKDELTAIERSAHSTTLITIRLLIYLTYANR